MNISITFEPSIKEYDDARVFMDKHDREKHGKTDDKPRYAGSIGGGWTWRFTPTSLGTGVSIACSCGEAELNVTDYEDW